MTTLSLPRRIHPRVFFLGLAIAVFFVFCVLPFLSLFAHLEPASFRELLAMRSTRMAILNTVKVSALVTFACLAAGVPLAWLLSRTEFPRASAFRSLLCLPFAVPPYIGAIAWTYLANPSTGLLNRLLGSGTAEHAPEAAFFNIYSLGGLVFVESSFLYTFILMTTLAAFDRLDPSLEEGARMSGASPWRVFKDVSLPLILPSLLSGGVLVFLATAASFGVPALIGGPARIFLMTTQIYTLQKMGSISALLRAGALSSLLMALALVALATTNWLAHRSRVSTVGGKTSRPSLIALGRFRAPATIAVCAYYAVVFVLPMAAIALSSVSHVQGEVALSNFTLEIWRRTLFEVTETARALGNSLFLGASAATVAVAVAVFAGYLQAKTKTRGRGLLDLFASLPYATPGTVVALSAIVFFCGPAARAVTQALFGIPSLYNTLGLILIAYVVKYLSFAVKTTTDGYRQIDDVLAEAARVSGASWLRTLWTIWLPLLKPALVASWFLVFMPALSELTMTTLLTGPGLETIGTVTFQLQDYADAGGGAAVLAMIVVATVMAINFTVKRVSRGKYGI